MRSARWILTAVAALTSVTALAAPPATAAPADPDPVIFVHGWNGGAWNWNDMVSDFKAAGYADDRLIAWDYDHTQSNKTTAEELSTLVGETLAATGAEKVDIITHSMGGLNSRWYLKFLGGTAKVDDWVSIGGPNHGTEVAGLCFDTSCEEMRVGSEFLGRLNEGDETPDGTNYGTWWSTCDGVINPADSTVVDGASNTRTGCINHLALLTDDGVSQQVRDFVA
ncbi:esterase/lipase family protein [Saccharopolyspora taberi]|uniref:Triacylglycerol lipase n=1 Tax=Saccharopolyspora taberi TaxID=60895 RepID=A0ABN3VL32_9PSEU